MKSKELLTRLRDFSVADYLEVSSSLPRFIVNNRMTFEVNFADSCVGLLTEAVEDYLSIFISKEKILNNISGRVNSASRDLWDVCKMGEKVNKIKRTELISTDELIQNVIGYTLLKLAQNTYSLDNERREVIRNILNIYYVCHRHRLSEEVCLEIKKYFLLKKNTYLFLINRQETLKFSKESTVSKIFEILISQVDADPTSIFEGFIIMSNDGSVKFMDDLESALFCGEIPTTNIINFVSLAGHNSNLFYTLGGMNQFCTESLALKGRDWSERIELETKLYNLSNEVWDSYLKL
jgi:hypothetical protein